MKLHNNFFCVIGLKRAILKFLSLCRHGNETPLSHFLSNFSSGIAKAADILLFSKFATALYIQYVQKNFFLQSCGIVFFT